MKSLLIEILKFFEKIMIKAVEKKYYKVPILKYTYTASLIQKICFMILFSREY